MKSGEKAYEELILVKQNEEKHENDRSHPVF
jgi:hypothetical protein